MPSNYFRPRDEAIAFDLQIRNEKTLLQFIEKKFVIDLMKAKKEHVSQHPEIICLHPNPLFFQYLPGKHDEL